MTSTTIQRPTRRLTRQAAHMGSSSSKVTRRYTPKPKLNTLYKPITDPGEYTLPASVLRDQQRRKQQETHQQVTPEDGLGGPSTVRQQAGIHAQASERRPEGSDGKDVQFLDMLKRAGYGGDLSQHSTKPSPASSQATASTPSKAIRTAPANPSGNLFTARKQLAEDVKAHTEQLEESLGQPARQWLEMSEVTRLLDARKQGAQDAELMDRFGLHPSVLQRLGKAINTPTVTEAMDENGNAKGVWQDKA
ncbi:hypothetical protein BCR37DRAFT_213447 [Protomyces lactucae-debilis]|uniref:Uncharacterized protein n=1 Tax=Protomyces lactucae-debilis TaxID=2754530 RepID=A0A1Y2FQJ6_PROLT|nr:uncharacterized protein BCR37DRAFT_213447 [Protomyces lactucae-debilis]ORY86271.1 hypothetical protein BCR37DRAFT_213447 [Protomyces lactucae-debilis]